MPDNPCGCKPYYDDGHWTVDSTQCEFADLERKNAELLEACNRFAPVLDWLSSLSENTVGRGLARQIKPFMDKALGKEPDHD